MSLPDRPEPAPVDIGIRFYLVDIPQLFRYFT